MIFGPIEALFPRWLLQFPEKYRYRPSGLPRQHSAKPDFRRGMFHEGCESRREVVLLGIPAVSRPLETRAHLPCRRPRVDFLPDRLHKIIVLGFLQFIVRLEVYPETPLKS